MYACIFPARFNSHRPRFDYTYYSSDSEHYTCNEFLPSLLAEIEACRQMHIRSLIRSIDGGAGDEGISMQLSIFLRVGVLVAHKIAHPTILKQSRIFAPCRNGSFSTLH